MGTPPSSPPPSVQAFHGNRGGQEGAHACASAWKRIAQTPTCNGCHGVIDPLGFALENFDVTGAWRTKISTPACSIDAQRARSRTARRWGPAGTAAQGAAGAP